MIYNDDNSTALFSPSELTKHVWSVAYKTYLTGKQGKSSSETLEKREVMLQFVGI